MSTTVRKGKVIVAAALTSVALLGAVPLHAASDDLKISFKSYMLDSNAAASDLYASIESKVEKYCQASGVRSLADRRVESECVSIMLDRSVATIDHKRLTAIHEGRVGNERTAP
ncbi:MAG: UrcA family protein [Pseudomonadota bacterium]